MQARTGLCDAQYWTARRASSISLVSIDAPLEDGSSLADRLGDPDPGVSSGLEQEELSGALAQAVARLPGRDRLVLSLYYVDGLTMAGVAKAMDISETRVSQLLQRTYARLRADRGLAWRRDGLNRPACYALQCKFCVIPSYSKLVSH